MPPIGRTKSLWFTLDVASPKDLCRVVLLSPPIYSCCTEVATLNHAKGFKYLSYYIIGQCSPQNFIGVVVFGEEFPTTLKLSRSTHSQIKGDCSPKALRVYWGEHCRHNADSNVLHRSHDLCIPEVTGYNTDITLLT